MKVVLKKDIPSLGKSGDIVNVKDGYGNYLVKNGFAEICSESILRKLENERKVKDSVEKSKREKAIKLKEKIESLKELVFEKASSKDGKIFGSVSNIEVMEELKKRGILVERHMIEMPHIKEVGVHTVKIKLYPGVEANLAVKIIPRDIGSH